MSFKFNWSACKEESFSTRLRGLLTDALKSSAKPSIIIDDIIVKDLVLGNEAPRLEILDIGDVADDKFRGIFKINYTGNASITLATTIEANPMRLYEQGAASFACPTIVAASNSLPMPLNLSLSDIKLSGIVILVFSKAKGLTLVFRNDPLESIKVSSSFDTLPMISDFLQVQIENVIRALFRDQLPGILHRLSQRFTPEGASSAPASKRPSTSDIQLSSNKPVAFNEINPESPEFSLSNMLKLETMCASQRTLNLFTPSIPDAVYRSNLDVFDNGMMADETLSSDVADIYRAYQLKGARKIKPKKRVIKLGKKNETSSKEQPAAKDSSVPKFTPQLSRALSEPAISDLRTFNSRPIEPSLAQRRIATGSRQLSPNKTEPPENLKPIIEESDSVPVKPRLVADKVTFAPTEKIEKAEKTHVRPKSEKSFTDHKIKLEVVEPDSLAQSKATYNLPTDHEAEKRKIHDEESKQRFFKTFFSANFQKDGPPPAYVA